MARFMRAKAIRRRSGLNRLFVPNCPHALEIIFSWNCAQNGAALSLPLITLFAAALLQSQTAPPNKGKEIVDQSVKALGGDRFLNMHTRHVSGRIYSFFHDQMSGYDVANIYTQYLDDKDLKGVEIRERQVLGKKQDYSSSICPTKPSISPFAAPVRWKTNVGTATNALLPWIFSIGCVTATTSRVCSTTTSGIRC